MGNVIEPSILNLTPSRLKTCSSLQVHIEGQDRLYLDHGMHGILTVELTLVSSRRFDKRHATGTHQELFRRPAWTLFCQRGIILTQPILLTALRKLS